jgi:hypothetical protein
MDASCFGRGRSRACRLVGVHLDGAQLLERRGVVDVDRRAGLVDVEQLAVGRHAQRHARAAVEGRAVEQLPLGDVEGPELETADRRLDRSAALHQSVGALAIRRHREADALRRTNRGQINRLRHEIDAPDIHDAAVLDRVLGREQAGEESRILVEVVH